MIDLWHRYKAKRIERSLLLICAGSDQGRVPYAMLSRKAGAAATLHDREVSIEYPIGDSVSWHIVIIAKTNQYARDLVRLLSKQKIYTLYPDAHIDAILFRRDDWGSEPQWIGGNISYADVSPHDYFLNGNRAYIHKQQAEQGGGADAEPAV